MDSIQGPGSPDGNPLTRVLIVKCELWMSYQDRISDILTKEKVLHPIMFSVSTRKNKYSWLSQGVNLHSNIMSSWSGWEPVSCTQPICHSNPENHFNWMGYV